MNFTIDDITWLHHRLELDEGTLKIKKADRRRCSNIKTRLVKGTYKGNWKLDEITNKLDDACDYVDEYTKRVKDLKDTIAKIPGDDLVLWKMSDTMSFKDYLLDLDDRAWKEQLEKFDFLD